MVCNYGREKSQCLFTHWQIHLLSYICQFGTKCCDVQNDTPQGRQDSEEMSTGARGTYIVTYFLTIRNTSVIKDLSLPVEEKLQIWIRCLRLKEKMDVVFADIFATEAGDGNIRR